MTTGRRLVSTLVLPLVAAALACALAPPAADAAQAQPTPPRRVSAIRLVVDGRPATDPVLLKLVGLTPAQSLSPVAIRETIVRLMALGRFDDIVARVNEEPGGPVLTFEATSTRKVTRIVFTGVLGLPADDLRAAVTERYGTSPPLDRAPDLARILQDLCREHGFLAARVTGRVEAAPEPDRATMTFEVAAGPRVRAGALAVTGQAGMSSADVLDRCGLRAGEPFDPVVVRRKASDLAETLHAQKYFEATVTPEFSFAENGETGDVSIAVNRGPLVTLVFTGDPLPSARVADLVPVQREGSVDEDLLEDSQRNIENFFRAQGYRDAAVTYSRESSDGMLRVVFNVSRGPQFHVTALDVVGNSGISAADLRAGLRSQPGALYVKAQLDADVAIVVERYRRLGYALVKVAPVEREEGGRLPANQAAIGIRLVVTEGPRTLIGSVAFVGDAQIPSSQLVGFVQAAKGRPFDVPAIERDRQAILVVYLNRGYQSATVEAQLVFSGDRQVADVTYQINEGPQILVDQVLIVGNVRTKVQTIERELVIRHGQPLATDLLVESQQRLIALGLFRRVSVTELQRGSETWRDVLVAVEEGPATTFSYGGGIEGSRRLLREGPGGNTTVERFEFAPRGFFDVGRRNLWGKNRTINFFARISVRPTDPAPVSSEPDALWVGGGLGISDYRVQANYREPRVVGERSDLTVTGLAEQGYRSSFNFSRQLGRVELLHHTSRAVSISGSFSVENTHLFDERFNAQEALLIDRAFPQVRLSFIGSTIARDKRDDALDPSSGTLLSLDGQLATKFFGSEVGLVKTFAQGFWFKKLPGIRRVVFAGGARIGLATGFPTDTPVLDADGNPVIGPDGKPLTVVTTNIPASERFYAGGDTTVRAYTRDTLGTPATIDSDGFPHGGMGMIILNAEFRFTVWRWLGAVTFLDIGNVYFRVSDIRLGDLKPAIGAGLRFKWPILPIIRLDVGYNPYPRTFGNGTTEKAYAIYLGIGQAF